LLLCPEESEFGSPGVGHHGQGWAIEGDGKLLEAMGQMGGGVGTSGLGFRAVTMAG
jgi:hypothetical protein